MKNYCSIKMKPAFSHLGGIQRGKPPLAERKKINTDLSGAVHIFTLGVMLVIFAVGGGYLYSINRSAVQGYRMRALEKEIDKLKTENAELKITEADLKSLYRIESSEEALAMQKPENIVYLEERESVRPVALR